MVNNIWVLRNERTQNNGRNSSPNTHFKTLQNSFTNLNNYNQERSNEKNIVDVTTLPMVPFSFTSKNPRSFITSVSYGRTLPLSSCNTSLTPYPLNAYQNSKGYATGYRNSSKLILHNQKNFRYSPFSEVSGHNTNSMLFNDYIPRSRIASNSYQSLKNIDIPNSNPPLFRPIKSKDLDLFFSSGDGNAHSAKHQVFDIRKTDAWKMSMTQTKELLLFKDDKSTIPVIKNGDADENDDEYLDLSLHL